MKKVVTRHFHAQNAQQVAQNVASGDHYLFTGDHVSTSTSNIAESDQVETTAFDNMLYGKQISASDVAVMFPRRTWASGTVYDRYSNVLDTLCHVVVESGSTYNVYKCLDNANEGTSTVQPSGTSLNPFTTADGYVWKYMFGVPLATFQKFSTTKYMPYVANTSVISGATASTIDVVDVETGGSGYNNYFLSEFRTADLPATTGSSVVYGLTETASNVNDFYNGCYIKITDQSSPIVGEYRKIIDYVVSGPTKRITLESAFSQSAASADSYEIYPGVEITSAGEGATPAVAWAIVNPAQANTISTIEVLTPGSGHRSATATVAAHSSVGVVTAAVVSPIVSPPGGHGSTPIQEIGGKFVGIASTIVDADTDVPQSNVINTFGILHNPAFRSGTIPLDASLGSNFTVDEQVIFYKTVATIGTSVTYTGTAITGTSQSFLTKMAKDDYVLIASDSSHGMIAQVSSVTNDNAAITYGNFVGTITGTLSIIRVISTGKLKAKAASTLTVERINGKITTQCEVLGLTSGRFVAVGTPSFNDSKTDFTKFTQAVRLTGTVGSGTLVANEKIVQGSASAYIHSIVNNGNGTYTLYVTKQVGDLATGSITGQTSGATFTITTKYDGDLINDAGQIVYIENIAAPYTRASSQSEVIKIILEL